MNWVDVLAPGATRIPSPVRVNPYDAYDTYGTPTYRNDFVDNGDGVLGPGDWISGSGDAYGNGRTFFGQGGSDASPASTALAAALTTQQGKVAAAQRRAAAGLAALEPYAFSSGPTIGGHAIDSAGAIPFLSALGQIKPETEEERRRRESQKLGFGASIPA